MKVGTVTIGQSPRSDVVPEIRRILGPDIEIVEKGALDGMDLKGVKALHPGPDDAFMVTRLRDGTEMKITKESAVEGVRRCVSGFQAEPVDVILLLCTGEFPELASEKLLLRPDRIMRNVVKGLLDTGKLGVVVPFPGQIRNMKAKWENTGFDLTVEGVSPYTATDEEIRETARKMKAAEIDLTILDCIGFGREVGSIFREITRRPVLVPVMMMASIVRGILSR
jgi:protein AroM